MSNLATRSRRTVPLDAAEEGNDHSIQTIDEQSSSMQSSGHLATHLVPPRRQNSDNSRRSSGSSSRRSRGSNPQNYLQGTEEFAILKGDGRTLSQSHHSRDESISIQSTYSKGSFAQSAVSAQSLPTDELKRSLRQPPDPSPLRTPSLNKSRTLTIGSSSNLGGSRYMLSATSPPLTTDEELSATILPDLFSLEQALAECEEDDLKAGLERLYPKQKQIVQQHQSQQSPGSRLQKTPYHQKTPIAWKTPFEVDAPREKPGRTSSLARVLRLPGSPSSTRSSVRDMTDEQDAWAGIDELLETKSVDDSYCMSTTDILPRAVVRGMRRESSRSVFGESESSFCGSVFGESVAQESVGSGASRSSKRSAEPVSKSSSSRSSNRHGLNHEKAEIDADDADSSKDELGVGRIAPDGRNVGNSTSLGGLFDMFHWSEKDNVDALRERKTKLNSQKHKISFAPVAPVVADDNCSLPSLASIRDDDSALVPNHNGKDWQTLVTERETFIVNFKPVVKTTRDKPDKEQQQQEQLSSTKPSPRIKKVKKSKSALKKSKIGHSDPASEKMKRLSFEPMPQLLELAHFEQQEDDNAWNPTAIAHDFEQKPEESAFAEVANEESEDEIAPSSSNDIEPGASIILEEKVDEYIREIQDNSPPLARGNLSSKKKNGNNTMAQEGSPSPTSVVDDGTSPFEELPSLTSLSDHSRISIPSHQPTSQNKPKFVEKKEAKPSSFAKLFRKTVKKKEKSPPVTGRGDEKYFPQEVLETSKDTSNHCLLFQGDDGVNWD